MTEAVCPHGDPFCPCPDGDPCHYEPYPEAPTESGKLPMPCPGTGNCDCGAGGQPRTATEFRSDDWAAVAERERKLPPRQDRKGCDRDKALIDVPGAGKAAPRPARGEAMKGDILLVTLSLRDELTPALRRLSRHLWWYQYGERVAMSLIVLIIALLVMAAFTLGRMSA